MTHFNFTTLSSRQGDAETRRQGDKDWGGMLSNPALPDIDYDELLEPGRGAVDVLVQLQGRSHLNIVAS